MKNNTYENNEANATVDNVITSANCRPEPIIPNPISPVLENSGKLFGIDSSLLFFFLILVCIINNSNCGIGQDTLLLFFLLLVLLMNNNFAFGSGI
jgi:hypothetical protein